ncbi:MAG: sodium:proton antiporter [Alphaproteobacteria bacterium]|nr:sodium:proton antiporter [Alphaproteobacteria bacterium]
MPDDVQHIGFLSVLPALVAIGLAFATRQVLLALFLGVVTGSVALYVHSGDPADLNFLSRFFIPSLGSESYAKILVIYLWSLGGLIGIWEKTGGALHFAEEVGGRIAKGPRSSLFFAWLLGCVFHQGGTVSTVLAGTTVKPVADKHRIAHEELAYVVDSTASPVATVLPFNAWPGFVAGLVVGTVPLFQTEQDGVVFFFESIFYNFYAVFALLLTLLFALGVLPWVGGRMARARDRARETGKLDGPGARPMLPPSDDASDNRNPAYQPSLVDFVLPIGLLLTVAVGSYVLFKVGALSRGYIDEAFVICTLSAMGVALVRGLPLTEVIDGFLDGCKSMTIGAVILGLAVTIGNVAKQLHTADYLVELVGSQIPVVALPAILMGLCMAIAFSTGTSWGTYAVVFPVAMPLAWALLPDPTYMHICFGAVLGGAVFGDQCSPISDTTILSSMFTGCDLMDHVTTQMPLALAAAGLGAVASTLVALAFT